jgi:hypothetical protein
LIHLRHHTSHPKVDELAEGVPRMKRFLMTALVVAGLMPAASHAAAPRFTAHAELLPSGCVQALAGSAVSVSGCTADAPATGTVPGRLRIGYSAKMDIVRGVGAQQGSLTLVSASGKDVLVARFRGKATMSDGSSRGTWTAVRRQGVFAKLRDHGSYVSRTPDRGVHVAFDVRG